jgi:predicted phosphodiesterase
VILGNADDEVLTRDSDDERLNRVSQWTFDLIGSEGVAFLNTFVPTCELSLGEAGTLLAFHGTPRSFDEVVLPATPSAELRDKLSGTAADVMCGGHTHLQWTTTIEGCRRYFNPGSVGLAYNRHLPRERFYYSAMAEFAVLTAEEADVRLEFCQVPFDLDALLKAIASSDHPFAEETAARYHRR